MIPRPRDIYSAFASAIEMKRALEHRGWRMIGFKPPIVGELFVASGSIPEVISVGPAVKRFPEGAPRLIVRSI